MVYKIQPAAGSDEVQLMNSVIKLSFPTKTEHGKTAQKDINLKDLNIFYEADTASGKHIHDGINPYSSRSVWLRHCGYTM